MLFDLKGKRRRVVQATYLTLAVLMGGGLVLFGIGGDVQGGLFDAFTGEGGRGGDGNSAIEKRIEQANQRLAANPRDEAALKDAIRGHYQLAADAADPSTGGFSPRARPELAKAAAAWERYLALDPKRVDGSLAGLMVQVYSDIGLNRPAGAAQAAQIVADARPSANAFLQVATYATLAGQERKAELAGDKALELASSDQRSTVKRQLRQLKQARSATGAPQGGGRR